MMMISVIDDGDFISGDNYNYGNDVQNNFHAPYICGSFKSTHPCKCKKS